MNPINRTRAILVEDLPDPAPDYTNSLEYFKTNERAKMASAKHPMPIFKRTRRKKKGGDER